MTKTMLHRAMSTALACTLIATTFAPAGSAAGAPLDLKTVLVGTWRLENAMSVTDSNFTALGVFTITTRLRTGGVLIRTGRWEIRNGNQVWLRMLNWFPQWTTYASGQKVPIVLPPWDSFTAQVVDADHIQVKAGTSVRISH